MKLKQSETIDLMRPLAGLAYLDWFLAVNYQTPSHASN
jgi:hypothetical protein